MLGLLFGSAWAASLDLLEVGGVYGTPNTDGGTAAWWNPAGFATSHGLQVHAEIAPTLGGVHYERAEPHGGVDEYRMMGAIPFVGVTHGLNQERFGLGAAFALPQARGAESIHEDGIGRYHLRGGGSKVMTGLVGFAWRPIERLSIGGVVSVVHSEWSAYLDSETLPELEEAIRALGEETHYTDSDLGDLPPRGEPGAHRRRADPDWMPPPG